jgi:type VI secretion system protein ImpH
MAGEDRQTTRVLELLQALGSEPHRFDLFQALRRLECAFRDRPRWGEASTPADEPARLGQEPSLSFAEKTIASFTNGDGGPPRLSTFAFGVFGPNGPLPLHLTEYARDRLRNSGDSTLVRFLDIFHHRMMTLFYRAFADAEPTIARDRPSSDPFAVFLGSLIGMGLPSTRDRGLVPDATKLHYAGLLAMQTRNADGLAACVGGLFRVPAEVEQFIGEWVDIPPGHCSQLGRANCVLGVDAVVGTRSWLCASKFRLVLGPLHRDRFEGFLPGSPALAELADLVRTYAGDELAWDLRLVLARPEWRGMALGGGRLGWNSWIGLRPERWQRAEFTFDPGSRGRSAPNRRHRGSSDGSDRSHHDGRVEAQAHV